jgi:hypothetical protein
MSLPAENSAWPPAQFAPAFEAMEEWDMWYRGDASDLDGYYAQKDATTPRIRPSQMSDGLIGRISRWFWGRPIPDGQSRTKVHVPLASDLATLSADLLFSEPPRILVPEQPDAVQARVNKIFGSPEVQAEFIEGAELSAALSGVYLRAVWDKDIADTPLPDAVSPDQAIPEWRMGRLVAVTFWEVLSKSTGGTWVRHLERHEPGRIVHAVFVGKQDNLGKQANVGDYEATAWLAQTEGVTREGLSVVVPTGIPQVTAVYIPNIRPQRLWRGSSALAPFGRSDFVSTSVFDAIDEVMSSWMRDIRLGKGRVFVPESFLEHAGEGKGYSWDPDREVYAGMNALGKSDQSMSEAIAPHQFEIRWEEHQRTLNGLIRTACRAAGLSPASWGDDTVTDGAQTATGVKANTQLTDRTRDKKVMYWRAGLSRFAQMLMNLDAAHFGGGAALGEVLPEVEFVQNPNQDPRESAETVSLLRAAEAASTETLVRLTHPSWDDTAVDEEVKKILDEKKASAPTLPDPADMRGGDLPDVGDEDEQEFGSADEAE